MSSASPQRELPGGAGGPAPASTSSTCDQCRVRKVRCMPTSASPGPQSSRTSSSSSPGRQCQSCRRRGQFCTFDYSRKTPGRPRGRKTMRGPDRSASVSTTSSRTPRHNRQANTTATIASGINSTNREDSRSSSPIGSTPQEPLSRPLGNAAALAGTTASHGVDVNMEPLTPAMFGGLFRRGASNAILAQAAVGGSTSIYQGAPLPVDWSSSGPSGLLGDDRSPLADPFSGLASAASLLGGGQASGGGPLAATDIDMDLDLLARAGVSPHNTIVSGGGRSGVPRTSHIEDVATWDTVGQFLSLYLRHQHVLVPLVHKPTFAQDVLHRRDRHDEAFRGVLFSMVAYIICNCPISILPASLPRPELQSLLRSCLRASRMIQIRHQTKPNELVLTSTILDWITSQSTGNIELGHNLMSDVRRLVYLLRLNHAVPREGMNVIDRELSRRLYWEAYAIDKTNALNGHPMSLHDAEGIPPLPLDLDDEQLTNDTAFSAPAGRVSTLTGFIAVSRLFQLLSGCLWRLKTLRTDPDSGPSQERILEWTTRAADDLHAVLDGLPIQLRPPVERDDAGYCSSPNSPFATQAANISITALCVEFAIIDLKSMLVPEENTAEDRKSTALRAFKELQSIPVESLASNGESMRGKVLRILSVLHTVENPPEDLDAHIWDWWGMFSRVHFLQVIPDRPASAVPTCPPSPNTRPD